MTVSIHFANGVDGFAFMADVDAVTDSRGLPRPKEDRSGSGSVEIDTDDADASSLIRAVLDVADRHGARATGVDEFLTAAEIAERLGVTRSAVSHYVAGTRGAGGFPPPLNPGARNEVWRWHDVAAWRGSVDPAIAREIAAWDLAVRLKALGDVPAARAYLDRRPARRRVKTPA